MSDVPLGRRAIRGAVALSGATYVSVLVGIGSRKILAYLLVPEQVGLYQTALSFVDVIFSFSAFSFASAIINVRENLVDEPLDYLHENVLILTLALNAVFVLIALVASFILLPSLGGMIAVAIAGVYIAQRVAAQLDTFYTQVLERKLSYNKISRVTLYSSLVLHAGAVVFAYFGGGAWAIPVATLLSTVLSFVLDRHFAHQDSGEVVASGFWRFYRPKTASWLWRFGWKLLFNRLFEAWIFRVDNLIVAWVLGSAMLGYYAQAFTLAQMPAIALAPIVARVSIAAYAEIQHDSARLEEAFAFSNFFLVRVLAVVTVVVLTGGRDLVALFLSPRWQPAVPALAALGGFVLITPLFENAKMLLGSKLKLMEISIVRGIQLLLLSGALIALAHNGLATVGLIVSAINVGGYLLLLFFVGREVQLQFMQNFALPIVFAVCAFALLTFIGVPANVTGGAAMRLVIATVVSSMVIIGLEYLLRRELYASRISMLLSRLTRA